MVCRRVGGGTLLPLLVNTSCGRAGMEEDRKGRDQEDIALGQIDR